MDHVAIMNPAWQLILKILSGEKTIESRWYQTRRSPWDRVRIGDAVYFKDSGKAITVWATISEVMQFELQDITDARRIIDKYGTEICLVEKDPNTWKSLPKYCILMRLIHPILLRYPFRIDRTGFGSGVAWLTVPDIAIIKKDI